MNQLNIFSCDQLFNYKVIARQLNFDLSIKNMQSCYILNRGKINAKIIINKKRNDKIQFKEFYHELTHHLLHSFSDTKNEFQADVARLFLMIPKFFLEQQLKKDNYEVDIASYAEIFNVSDEDMVSRLLHYKDNLND